eukprot:TRINITY_DN43945_c0_g1_i1.p1 TRINITY_DN43945_c0_g1~~TRINITY_DN43945_c0_g1_i1.p1  ORF type:complete len:440 (+),score=121.45 TRINITY_DN43945_c0_g1_i1:136-1455(+)
MGQQQSSNRPPGGGENKKDDQKKKKEPPPTSALGRAKKKVTDPSSLPKVTPILRCRLRYRRLERVMDYLTIEEEFIRTVKSYAPEDEEEDSRGGGGAMAEYLNPPLTVGTMEELVSEDYMIVEAEHILLYVPVLSVVNRDLLEPGSSVLVSKQAAYPVVGVLDDDADPSVSMMKVERGAQLESFEDIGGLEKQIEEIKDAVEYPLIYPEIYQEIGIVPPKGVILYGVPGTGKTLVARAVANSTTAAFLRMTGSELVKKHLGEGPKVVRSVFAKARSEAPCIVFLDEIDAIGTKRRGTTSSGEKEVQRTMLELLEQLDGFQTVPDVKVIMATNRIEALDPALIRPGRIDRKIEFPLPDVKTRREIFTIHTKRMTLASDVHLEQLVQAKDDLSGADIKAVCTEAGLAALRARRRNVTHADFMKAKESVLYKKQDSPAGMYL